MSLERLEALRDEMKKCVRCSLCKLVPMPTIQQTGFTSACPPVDEYHFHAYSGGGIQVMALALLDGRIKVDDELAQVVSACTTCGACDVSCKFIMAAERQDVILALKEHIFEAGLGVTPKTEKRSLSEHWADGLNLKTLPEDQAEVLLFVGTGASQNEYHATTARKAAQLLEFSGVNFGILAGDEPESGIEAYWTGQRQTFENQANQLGDRLNRSGAKTIVTLCGEDLGMLQSKYQRHGFTLKAKVVHISEFLLPLFQKGKLRLTKTIPITVTYHDPCYLGRQAEPVLAWEGEERLTHGVMRYSVPAKQVTYGTNGVYDPPRQVLGAIPGLEFVEMHRIREYAYCCGGGGGVPDSHPEVSRSAAAHRLDEALDVGAEVLVTACQHCRYNLSRWESEPPLEVMDLVDIVFEAAGLAE